MAESPRPAGGVPPKSEMVSESANPEQSDATDLPASQMEVSDQQLAGGEMSTEQSGRGQSSLATRFNRGFRQRGWQWLSLSITVPFLALNGLAAWQAYSLTHYAKPSATSRPLFAESPLKRLGAFAFGVKIPRPENQYRPADIGLAFESHRIDLGQGEFLDGWYVPAAEVQPEVRVSASPEEPGNQDTNLRDSPEPAGEGAQIPENSQADTSAAPAQASAGLESLPEPIQASKEGIVLLFPAYAASKQTLLQEIKLLHRLGYATFAIDHRGVGESSGSDTTLGRREAEDVAKAMDYVAQTFEQQPMALYGRVMAAGNILRAVAEYDLQPDALILEDPYAQLFSLTQTVVETVGLPRSPTTQMLTLWGGVLQGETSVNNDPINYASAIQTPTLVIYGSDDAWVSLNEVVGVHSQLQGPKEIVGLTSSRLMPVSATAPGAWMTRVELFLEEHFQD